jgi:hypothetical protein
MKPTASTLPFGLLVVIFDPDIYELISSGLAFVGDQSRYDIMELYPGYLEDHFNIHKLRFVFTLLQSPFFFFFLFDP